MSGPTVAAWKDTCLRASQGFIASSAFPFRIGQPCVVECVFLTIGRMIKHQLQVWCRAA